MKIHRSGTVSHIHVHRALSDYLSSNPIPSSNIPIQPPTPDIISLLKQTIKTRRKPNKEWTTIIDKEQLEQALLLYSQQHFQQARYTPFGSGPLPDLLQDSGLSSAANHILLGTLFDNFDPEVFPELQTFIEQLATPPPLRGLSFTSASISIDDYTSALQRWKESTATSPSGRHLGIYKALLKIGQITLHMCELLNIVTRTGFTPL